MHRPTEATTPEWLNNSFLQTALSCWKLDKTIEVLNFDVRSNFSEHFGSTMMQSKIEFKSLKYPKSQPETLNVVIKAMPVDEGLKMKVVSSGPLFETEIQMYSETIPAIHQLFERSGMKVELGPELIYATDKPFHILVLKDLTPDGFSAPRQPPEEFEDTKLIIQRLAQFHAASFYLNETNQQDFSNYKYSMYQSEPIIKEFFAESLGAFKEVVETWEGFEQYLPRLDNLMVNMAKIGQSSYTANKPGNGYNVLNHGDLHLRNLLLKLNAENRIDRFTFIDYQLSVYCSPVVDLSYVFGIIKRDENGDIPTEETIIFYHQEFVNALKAFGFMQTPPTLLDLNVELLKHGAINCLLLISFLPFSFIDWENMSVEDMMGNDSERSRNFKKSLYSHPICQQVIQRSMKEWLHKGWF